MGGCLAACSAPCNAGPAERREPDGAGRAPGHDNAAGTSQCTRQPAVPFRWTPAAWQAAHEHFQWRPSGPGTPASFEDLLRHVDRHASTSGAPRSCGGGALHARWQVRCTDRAREYARQVGVLEEDRARLCLTLLVLCKLRDRRGADNKRQRLSGMVQRIDAVCGVVEAALLTSELEMLKLGFAFAVAAHLNMCC